MAPKVHSRVTLYDLLQAELLHAGEQLVFDDHYATILENGDLYVGEPGEIPTYLQSTYQSLSSWCSDVRKRGRESAATVSGWVKARLASDPSRTLDMVRRIFMESQAPPPQHEREPSQISNSLGQMYGGRARNASEYEEGEHGTESTASSRLARFQQLVELAGREEWYEDENDEDFSESGSRGKFKRTKKPSAKAMAAAASAREEEMLAEYYASIPKPKKSKSQASRPARTGTGGAAGTSNASRASTPAVGSASGGGSVKERKPEDTTPIPPVVAFPLTTKSTAPETEIFTSVTSCVDCSAVFRKNEDHLTCHSCTEAHHPYCTPLYICPPPAVKGDPWICIFCTFCSRCNKSTPRDQLARCAGCQRVFHLDCVFVSADLIGPDGTIFCNDCAVCYSCGLKPRGTSLIGPPSWERHPVHNAYQCQLCTTYYSQENYCPVCLKAYPEDDFETPMVGCDGPCGKWVHKTCDPLLSNVHYDELHGTAGEYICPACRSPSSAANPMSPKAGHGKRRGSHAADVHSRPDGSLSPSSVTSYSHTPLSSPNLQRYTSADLNAVVFGPLEEESDMSQVSDAHRDLIVYVSGRQCCYCHQTDNVPQGVGRMVFVGGKDEGGQGLGQWAHSGCLYWSVHTSDVNIDQEEIANAVAACAGHKCALCRKGNANIVCPTTPCRVSYHWSCLVRALFYGGQSGTSTPGANGTPSLGHTRQKSEFGSNAELKRAKKAHLDVFQKQFRCSQHATSSTSGLKSFLPRFADCERVCHMRMSMSHPPTVPLYVSAVPAEVPGQLLTTAPPYDPACLVVGGAILTHIGRIPFDDPNLLMELRNPPLLVPVGYTVVRRFWSYKNPGTVTFLTMARIVHDELDALGDHGPPGSSTVQQSLPSKSADPVIDEGIVIQGEETAESVVVDRYRIDRTAACKLRWRIQIADDGQGTFYVSHISDAMPTLLGRFESPFPIAVNHHYLCQPESLVLLHHPVIQRFIESLPHAAQCTAYPFRYVERSALLHVRNAEQALRRGSSRTDPAWLPEQSKRQVGAAASLMTVPPGSPGPLRVPPLHAHVSPGTGAPENTSMPSSIGSSPNVASGEVNPMSRHTTGSGGPLVGEENWEHPVSTQAQYMKMKEMEKTHVEVRPSSISGIGLFANRVFSPHDMVIEYLGEVVGQRVADAREIINDREGIGTYFFAIEHDRILDATRKGNAARFINHSCDPNCYARIVAPVENVKRVVIFAGRRIDLNEELTYDYKFQLEENPSRRIRCYCGTAKCRGWMN